MKLRIRGNSIRLRLNQKQVVALAAGEELQERVVFPGGASLAYALIPSNEVNTSATFEDECVRIAVPRGEFSTWAASEDIGLYYSLPAGEYVLQLLIEKDLECVDGSPEEKDPHAYPRHASEKVC